MSTDFQHAGDRNGWPQVILFDLDGTLIDSVPDLRTAVNAVLEAEGLAPLDRGQIRSMVGLGVKKLVQRAFAAHGVTLEGEPLEAKTNTMMKAYGACLTNETACMPGALEMVRAFHKARIKIAIVTNKPEAATRTILDRLGFTPHVDAIVGGDSGPARKPAPDMLLHALQMTGFSAGSALMVGDSPHDIHAAKAAAITCMAVRGGYTDVSAEELGADHVIDTLLDLPAAIEALKEAV